MRTIQIKTNRGYLAAALIFGVLLLLGSLKSIYAQNGEGGTSSPLDLGASARALGMGRAYVAAVNDPSAVYWNPAGLESAPRLSVLFFHAPLNEGAKYDFLGFVYPTLQFGTVGIGYARVSIDGVPVVDKSNIREGSATFQTSEFYISYGKKLPHNLTGGVTFKIERQEFTFLNLVTGGIGIDLGLMYNVPFQMEFVKGMVIGFNYRNILKPELKLGATTEKLPKTLNLGLMKQIPAGLDGHMTFALDYSKSEFEPAKVRFGSEYEYRDKGAIRLGLDKSKIAFGAGLRYRFVDIDYSFGNLSTAGAFPATHRFSITFNLGKTREEQVLLAEEARKKREKELVERTRAEERRRFVDEHLRKAKALLNEKKFFDAQSEFTMVISEDPFNRTAKSLLDSVNSLIQTQLESRQKEAIASAVNKELAKKNKHFVELHFEKGQLLLQKNQFTAALIEFNLALERSPDDPIIKEAIQSAQRRLNVEVKNLVARGRQQFRLGNYSEALRILSEALVLSPEDPQLQDEINTLANRIKVQQYVQQALQLYDLGHYERALNLFEDALKLDPSNKAIQQYLERTRHGIGVVKEKMDPESERQYIVGTELFLKGRYQEALNIWQKLATRYPFNKKVRDAVQNAKDRIRRTKEKK